jgi:hypothetical protein
MKLFAPVVDSNPTVPLGIASKDYVDQRLSSGLGSVVIGNVYITDIVPVSSGIVGQKNYDPNTVPANAVLTEATTDNANVRVKIFAEGGNAFYSPNVLINGVQATLTKIATDSSRVYTGQADIVVGSGDTEIIAVSSTGAESRAIVHLAGAGPAIGSLVIGALPGSQTEVKSGDVVQVSGIVPNSATYVEVIAGGAAGALSSLTLGADGSAGSGNKTFSGTFTVGSGTGSQTIQARAKNALGTFGATATSSNSITLNQTVPTIGSITVAYPAGQSALKGSEVATVSATVTNGDVVSYTSSANLSVASPNTYAASKSVSRVSGGYVIGVNNYTITATKSSNGATVTKSAAISIADTAPTAAISITGSPARLISSAAGQSYTVTITANQSLYAAPSLSAPSGTWSGSWTGSGTTWSRTLVVKDTDAKGSFNFSGLSLPNLAGVIGNTISSGAAYTIGGFTTRTLTFAAFSQLAAIGTNVANISKVTAKYTGNANNLTLQNSTANAFQGFTITDATGNYDPNGGYLFITDQAYAGANTSGTLMVDIGEAA